MWLLIGLGVLWAASKSGAPRAAPQQAPGPCWCTYTWIESSGGGAIDGRSVTVQEVCPPNMPCGAHLNTKPPPPPQATYDPNIRRLP